MPVSYSNRVCHMTSRNQIKADEERVGLELLRNPNQDAASIARECGLSKQKVWRVLKQFEERGVIFSHPACLNMKKLGKRSFLVLIERSIKPIDDNFIQHMIDPTLIKALVEQDIKAVVEDCYLLNGVYDWAFIVTVEEHRDLLKFLDLWRKYYGEYFSRITQSEIMWFNLRNSTQNPNPEEIREILR